VPDFIEPDEVQTLRAFTRQLPQRLKEHTPTAIGVTWDGAASIQQVMHAEVICPPLDRINRSDRTLEFIRQFWGHDIGLYHSKFLLKDPGGFEVPWHQDFAYWTRQSASPCQLNCMVYLDDADEENGCLWVVPGSHRLGLAEHGHSSRHGEFHATLDSSDASHGRALPGRAGTAIFFGPLLFHASRRNASARHRHSFTTVYTNPLMDVHREVYGRFFPEERVKAITGPGPFRFCEEHYQRRNLWQLAVDLLPDPSWPWVEVSDRTFSDGSFEWLSARKDRRSRYCRYEQYPLSWSNRDDVEVRVGLLSDMVREGGDPAGLVYVDCEHAANARVVLAKLTSSLVPGTVVLLDGFFNCPDWPSGVYRVFQDFVVEQGIGFDYLGRCAQQVAVRLTSGEACGCPDIRWTPVSEGLRYG
jgi:hypothetical protein